MARSRASATFGRRPASELKTGTKRKAADDDTEPVAKRTRGASKKSDPIPAEGSAKRGCKKPSGTSKAPSRGSGKAPTRAAAALSISKRITSIRTKKGKKSNDEEGQPGPDGPSKRPDRRQNTKTGFPIKRILAEREIDGKSEYLVEWLPTWTNRKTAKGGKDEIISEWEQHKTDHYTIQTGSNHKLKVANPTNDDSVQQTQLMMTQVMEEFTSFISQPAPTLAATLFHENDWQFVSTIQEQAARKIAGRDETRANNDPSAAEVLRRCFTDRKTDPTNQWTNDNARRYARLRVQWLGNIDSHAPAHPGQPDPPGKTVREFLAPLFNTEWTDDQLMRVGNWNKTRAYLQIGPLRDAITTLIARAPYLLTHSLVLMLVCMFVDVHDIRDILSKSGFRDLLILDSTDPNTAGEDADDDGWDDRVRNDFIYAYMHAHEAWEKRTMESVSNTFTACQVWLEGEYGAWLDSDERAAAAAVGPKDDEDDGGNAGEGASELLAGREMGENEGEGEGLEVERERGEPEVGEGQLEDVLADLRQDEEDEVEVEDGTSVTRSEKGREMAMAGTKMKSKSSARIISRK